MTQVFFHRYQWYFKATKHLLLLGCCLFLVFSCGRRTPPKPKLGIPEDITISSVSVIQRGSQIRLSWKMISKLPAPGLEQIVVEEDIVQPYCFTCRSAAIRRYVIPLPSDPILIFGDTLVFYPPSVFPDPNIHMFTLFHQTTQGKLLGKPGIAKLEGFVAFPEIPTPRIELVHPQALEGVQSHFFPGSPTQLEGGQFYKLSWESKVEKSEFLFPNTGEPIKNIVYYKTNLYRTQQGYPWPEYPFQSSLTQPFYMLFQPQEYFLSKRNPQGIPMRDSFLDFYKHQNKNYLYQIRLVDSKGNESEPSAIVAVRQSQEPSFPPPSLIEPE